MKTFHRADILSIRKTLKDDAAGNKQATMTDLDLAYDMLGELLSLKHTENRLLELCKTYFAHPHCPSKTKRKHLRKTFREVLKRFDRYNFE
jgi:hypothetical protein